MRVLCIKQFYTRARVLFVQRMLIDTMWSFDEHSVIALYFYRFLGIKMFKRVPFN